MVRPRHHAAESQDRCRATVPAHEGFSLRGSVSGSQRTNIMLQGSFALLVFKRAKGHDMSASYDEIADWYEDDFSVIDPGTGSR